MLKNNGEKCLRNMQSPNTYSLVKWNDVTSYMQGPYYEVGLSLSCYYSYRIILITFFFSQECVSMSDFNKNNIK